MGSAGVLGVPYTYIYVYTHVSDTIAVLGIWDHVVGNYCSGPCMIINQDSGSRGLGPRLKAALLD